MIAQIWEGTVNVLALDGVRAAKDRTVIDAFVQVSWEATWCKSDVDARLCMSSNNVITYHVNGITRRTTFYHTATGSYHTWYASLRESYRSELT